MKLIRVAAAALNQTPLDWDRNLDNIIEAVRAAKKDEASVLCLPELCLTGYGCEDAFLSSGVFETCQEMLYKLLPETAGIAVSVGMPVIYAGAVFNTACLIVNQQVVGVVCKQNLAADGIHYEPRWFKEWPAGIFGYTTICGEMVPIGDVFFDVGGVKIGFEICEDAWVGSRPGASLASRGADLLLNPSASHFAFKKHSVRHRFVLEGSRAFNVTYVYSNLVGNESGRVIFDGDVMIASAGQMAARGPRLRFSPVTLTAATVDIDATRMQRARTGSFEPELDGDESDLVDVAFEWPERSLKPIQVVVAPWEESEHVKFEEFTRAVALGLFDYLRKSRAKGYVVSLSGGVDSAAVSVLVWAMAKLAMTELNFGELAKIFRREFAGVQDAQGLVAELLTTVYQSTKNSSEVTANAAQAVATAIGANHFEWSVNEIVESFRGVVEKAIVRKLDWVSDDVTLQNIQARTRSPGVWMIANVLNAILLATSNRSEAAVGYATMDGDTSGGLAPIAGIDKAFLRRWLKWMEKEGPIGLGAIGALAHVNKQEPTAELRPQSAAQTDEGDLMPYDVLDQIERLAIRDKLMPLEVFKHLQVQYPEQTSIILAQWVIKFFRLWCRSQWKRERFAPSFHLDDESLDPKTWCRFPILSGGFEREIATLQEFVSKKSEKNK
ncbi:MAG: NAD(+) synthase [Pirellulaceae bacterium]